MVDPEINQATIDAVAHYFDTHRGEHYSPHVSIGVGTTDYLNALLAAPFPTFTFSIAERFGLPVGQLWNGGEAAPFVQAGAVISRLVAAEKRSLESTFPQNGVLSNYDVVTLLRLLSMSALSQCVHRNWDWYRDVGLSSLIVADENNVYGDQPSNAARLRVDVRFALLAAVEIRWTAGSRDAGRMCCGHRLA